MAISPQHLNVKMTLVINTFNPVPMMVGEVAYLITNLDANPVYIGFDPLVSSVVTSIPSGASAAITCSYQNPVSGTQIWLFSFVGTAPGAITVLGVS